MIEAARAAGKPVLIDPKGPDYFDTRGPPSSPLNRAELQHVIGAWRSEDELVPGPEPAHGIELTPLFTRSEEVA